jgi:hypothetical protein
MGYTRSVCAGQSDEEVMPVGRLIPEERIPGDRVKWSQDVPAVLLERLKALEPYVNGRSEYAWGTLNVKAVARLALLRGIEALERERDKAKGKAEK